jgi:uncharacterized protein YbdZ (MbtH family)
MIWPKAERFEFGAQVPAGWTQEDNGQNKSECG